MRYGIVKICILVGIACWVTACSIQEMAANQTVGVLAIGAQAFYEETDYEIAGLAMPANLKTMEALGVLANENSQLYTILAQSYCSYAFGWLEPEWMLDTRSEFDDGKIEMTDRIVAIYDRGKNYGLRSLDLENDGFAEAVTTLPTLQEALKELDEDDVPALTWATYCWASGAQYKLDDMETIADLPFIRAMLERLLELDETYFNGIGHVLLGSFEAQIPPAFGGNLPKAKMHFDKALEIADRKFLSTQEAMAKYYAVSALDEDMFDQLLDEVLDADSKIFPQEALANRIAKERAKALKQIKGDLF